MKILLYDVQTNNITLSTQRLPQAMRGLSCIYDSARETVFIFGGYDNKIKYDTI